MKPSSPYSPHYEKLRSWMKERREEGGFTLRDVAKGLNCHHSVIGKMEQGRRKIEVSEFVSYCIVIGADPHKGLELIIGSLTKNDAF